MAQNFRITVDDQELVRAFTSLEKDAKTFESVMSKLGDKVDNVFQASNFAEFQQAITAQKEVVQSLTDEYSRLSKERDEWANQASGTNLTNEQIRQQQAEYDKIEKQLSRIDRELQGETRELARQQESLNLIQREYDTIANKSNTYLTQLRKIREEMASLVSSDGTIPKENIERYNELSNRLGELGTAYRRVQQEQRLVTQAGNAMVAGITQGLQAIAGTFTLVQGISAMFTDDAEKIQEIQKKLQTAMAITMGIQQVSTALHATSNLRIGLVAKATTLWDTAQKALNTSLGIGAGLSKAFLTGGVMALVVGVGYLVTQYSKWSAEQKKISDLANSYLETTAKEVIQVQTLVNALKSATKDTKEYADARKEVNKIAVQYGLEQVKESDNLDEITRKQKAYTSAVLETAKAKGLETATAKASEKFAKDWSNSLDDVYSQFQKRFGKDAPEVFAKFSQDLMESGGVITESMKEIYDSFIVRGTSSQWSMGLDTNKIQSNIEDAKKAFDEYSQALEFNNSLFKSNTTETEKYIGLLGVQQQKLEELKSKYGDVSQIRDEAVLKQYNQEKKRIEDEIKRLSSLGVETIKPTKQSKDESDYSKIIKEQITQLNKEREELEKQGIEGKIKLLQYEAQKELDIISKVKDEAIKLGREADVKMLEERERTLTQYYENLIQKEANATEESNLKKLDAFKSYLVRQKEIRDKYADLRKSAEGNSSIDVALIDDSEIEELENLSKEFNKDAEETAQSIASLFGDLSLMTARQLKDAIASVKDKLKLETSDPKELEAWQNQLNKLIAQLEGKSPFLSFEEKIKEAIDRISKGDALSGIEIIGEAIDSLLPHLNAFSADLKASIGDGVGDSVDGTMKTLEVLGGMAQGTAKIMSGDIVGGTMEIASGVAKIVGHSKQVNKEHREAIKLLDRQNEKLRIQYSIMLMQKEISDSKDGIFGYDKYGSALISLREYNKMLKQTEDLMRGTKPDESIGLLFEKMAENSNKQIAALGRKNLEEYNKQIDAYKKGVGALADIDIVIGSKKSGWGLWKKRKDVYDSVLNVYDDLIDAEGRLNIARAESIIQNKKMSDSDKEKLQNIIDSAKAAEEAYAEVDAYFSSIFGNLSDDLMTSVIDAFASGEKGLESFGDSAENMLKKLASDMVYYLAFSDIMEEAENEIKKIRDSDLTEEEKLKRYSEVMGNLKHNINNRLDYANSLLEMAEDATGIDFSSDIKPPKASQGYQVQMSQETGDEISGMVRGMQMTLLNQESEMIKQTDIFSNFGMQFGSMQQELQAISNATLQGVYYLQDIEKHTRVLPTFSDKLDKIEQNTR